MIWETLLFILYMFLIAIVIGCFNYVSSIVGLILWNLCNCSYSIHLENSWVNDWQYVDVVFRYLAYLRVLPNVPGHVVVRAADYYSCVYSSIVHPPPYISLVESSRIRGDVMSQYPP